MLTDESKQNTRWPVRDFLWLNEPTKVRGALFDTPLAGGGRTIGMGRFFPTPAGELVEVDWAQMTVPGCTFMQHAGAIADVLGVSEVVAPDPDFKGKLCKNEDLKKRVELEGGATLHFGGSGDCFYPLRPKQAYVTRNAGCLTCRIKYPGLVPRVGICHGSFKSLYRGVIANLVEVMQLTQEEHLMCKVSLIAPIHPKSFCHPTNHKEKGVHHKILCKLVMEKWGMACVPSFVKDPDKKTDDHLGQIDTEKIAIVECERLGIPRTNIERVAFGIDDGLRHTDGSPLWYSTRNYPDYVCEPEEQVQKEAQWRKRRNVTFVTA